MAHNGGKITAPVSIDDVVSVLGVNVWNGGYLCSNKHGKIKIFNLHKPIAVGGNEDTYLPLPMDSDLFRRYGLNYPKAVTAAVAGSGDSWLAAQWSYNPPREGYWWRLTDFEGYDHGASEPAQMAPIAGVGNEPLGYDANTGKTYTVQFSSDTAVPHILDLMPSVIKVNANQVYGESQAWYLCAILFHAGSSAKFITSSSAITRGKDITIELSGTALNNLDYYMVLLCLCTSRISSLTDISSPSLSGIGFVALPATLQEQFVTSLYPVTSGGVPILNEQITVGIWGFNNLTTRWIAGTHGMYPAGSNGNCQSLARSGSPTYKLQLGISVTNGTNAAITVAELFGTEGTNALISISQKGSFYSGDEQMINKYYVNQVGIPLTDGSPVSSGGTASIASNKTAYFVLDIYAPPYPLCAPYTSQANLPALSDDKKSAPITFSFGNTDPTKIVRGSTDASTLWLTVNSPS